MQKFRRQLLDVYKRQCLRNARGEIVGSSAIARDISAEKQSEEAVRRSEKLATAGRLAASIAHEINNPLEALANLLDVYKRQVDPLTVEITRT